METREVEASSFDKNDYMAKWFEGYDKKLNIGCGPNYREGWVNVDADENVKADKYAILGEGMLPFEDNEFDLILASHILEHIPNLVAAKKEITRVLRPGGRLVVIVPHYLSPDAWGDDTHCRAFGHLSFLQTYWPEFDGKKGYLGEITAKQLVTGEDLEWLVAVLQKRK